MIVGKKQSSQSVRRIFVMGTASCFEESNIGWSMHYYSIDKNPLKKTIIK
jgi:hypothetical protein